MRLIANDPSIAQRVLRGACLVLAGTALLTASAKVNLPLPYVPMTLQTLAVLMIGAVYGARLGTLTVLAYLGEGALGLPVFAGPVGGLAPLLGPTAGYLYGFVVAVLLAGIVAERGWSKSVLELFAIMTLGHVVIVGFGFAWLAFALNIGAEKAFAVGVAPFILGSVVKSALGALAMVVVRKAGAKQG